jgi:predicted transcriptional regulator of viral defense system
VSDRVSLRRRLNEIAFQQAGYFTAAQAKTAGYSYQAQNYHVSRGNWVRIDRRIFRLAEWPSSADDVYARWCVWSEGRGVISHESAAAVHELGDLDPNLVHLCLPGSRTSHTGVVLHPDRLERSDIEDRASFRVTTPARTLLDLASTHTSQEQLTTAVQDALSAGLVTATTLRRRMDDFGPVAALRLERALATEPATT